MRRLLFIAAMLAGLVLSAITYAAGDRQLAAVSTQAPTVTTGVPTTVVVPDVRREAFVFAKEQLQDAGFAWKVVGATAGYAAKTVVSQSPAPGTKLVDTGAPLITLTLSRNAGYRPVGEPENTSPYSPTPNRLAGSS